MKNVWQRLHDSEEINMREDVEFRDITIPEMNRSLGLCAKINTLSPYDEETRKLVEELLEYGYVRGRVELKISLVDINSMQSAFMHGLTQTGIYVSEVQKDSNAEKAGLQVGDKITAINSTPVSTTEEIQNILSDLKVGDQITITVQRNNETLDISFVLEEYTP